MKTTKNDLIRLSEARPAKDPRHGFALALVMALLLILSAIVGILATMSSQSAFTARRLGDLARAQSVAESGVHDAFSIISSNYALRTNTTVFPRTQWFAGGNYTATLVTNVLGATIIRSTGRYGSAEVEVIMDAVRVSGPTPSNPPPTDAYGYAIIANTFLALSGNVTIQAGGTSKVHCNGAVEVFGTTSIAGNLTACNNIYANGNAAIPSGYVRTATGWKRPPNKDSKFPVNISCPHEIGPVATFTAWPDLPLDAFRKWADNNNMYFTNNQQWGSGDIPGGVIPGGVLYIKGTFKYTGGNVVGCIIAEKGIDWQGGNLTKTNSYPAMVTTEPTATISITANQSIRGLIYTMNGGSITKRGGGTITGTVLCRGTIDFGGGVDTVAYEYSYPTPPGTPVDAGKDQVFVSAWQK
jgi:hypothetical protein